MTNVDDIDDFCLCSVNDSSCYDCADICGGAAAIDECGICYELASGDSDWNTTCADCADTPNGTAVLDNCNVCDADASNDCVQDCAGTWGGSSVDDDCTEIGECQLK